MAGLLGNLGLLGAGYGDRNMQVPTGIPPEVVQPQEPMAPVQPSVADEDTRALRDALVVAKKQGIKLTRDELRRMAAGIKEARRQSEIDRVAQEGALKDQQEAMNYAYQEAQNLAKAKLYPKGFWDGRDERDISNIGQATGTVLNNGKIETAIMTPKEGEDFASHFDKQKTVRDYATMLELRNQPAFREGWYATATPEQRASIDNMSEAELDRLMATPTAEQGGIQRALDTVRDVREQAGKGLLKAFSDKDTGSAVDNAYRNDMIKAVVEQGHGDSSLPGYQQGLDSGRFDTGIRDAADAAASLGVDMPLAVLGAGLGSLAGKGAATVLGEVGGNLGTVAGLNDPDQAVRASSALGVAANFMIPAGIAGIKVFDGKSAAKAQTAMFRALDKGLIMPAEDMARLAEIKALQLRELAPDAQNTALGLLRSQTYDEGMRIIDADPKMRGAGKEELRKTLADTYADFVTKKVENLSKSIPGGEGKQLPSVVPGSRVRGEFDASGYVRPDVVDNGIKPEYSVQSRDLNQVELPPSATRGVSPEQMYAKQVDNANRAGVYVKKQQWDAKNARELPALEKYADDNGIFRGDVTTAPELRDRIWSEIQAGKIPKDESEFVDTFRYDDPESSAYVPEADRFHMDHEMYSNYLSMNPKDQEEFLYKWVNGEPQKPEHELMQFPISEVYAGFELVAGRGKAKSGLSRMGEAQRIRNIVSKGEPSQTWGRVSQRDYDRYDKARGKLKEMETRIGGDAARNPHDGRGEELLNDIADDVVYYVDKETGMLHSLSATVDDLVKFRRTKGAAFARGMKVEKAELESKPPTPTTIEQYDTAKILEDKKLVELPQPSQKGAGALPPDGPSAQLNVDLDAQIKQIGLDMANKVGNLEAQGMSRTEAVARATQEFSDNAVAEGKHGPYIRDRRLVAAIAAAFLASEAGAESTTEEYRGKNRDMVDIAMALPWLEIAGIAGTAALATIGIILSGGMGTRPLTKYLLKATQNTAMLNAPIRATVNVSDRVRNFASDFRNATDRIYDTMGKEAAIKFNNGISQARSSHIESRNTIEATLQDSDYIFHGNRAQEQEVVNEAARVWQEKKRLESFMADMPNQFSQIQDLRIRISDANSAIAHLQSKTSTNIAATPADHAKLKKAIDDRDSLAAQLESQRLAMYRSLDPQSAVRARAERVNKTKPTGYTPEDVLMQKRDGLTNADVVKAAREAMKDVLAAEAKANAKLKAISKKNGGISQNRRKLETDADINTYFMGFADLAQKAVLKHGGQKHETWWFPLKQTSTQGEKNMGKGVGITESLSMGGLKNSVNRWFLQYAPPNTDRGMVVRTLADLRKSKDQTMTQKNAHRTQASDLEHTPQGGYAVKKGGDIFVALKEHLERTIASKGIQEVLEVLGEAAQKDLSNLDLGGAKAVRNPSEADLPGGLATITLPEKVQKPSWQGPGTNTQHVDYVVSDKWVQGLLNPEDRSQVARAIIGIKNMMTSAVFSRTPLAFLKSMPASLAKVAMTDAPFLKFTGEWMKQLTGNGGLKWRDSAILNALNNSPTYLRDARMNGTYIGHANYSATAGNAAGIAFTKNTTLSFANVAEWANPVRIATILPRYFQNMNETMEASIQIALFRTMLEKGAADGLTTEAAERQARSYAKSIFDAHMRSGSALGRFMHDYAPFYNVFFADLNSPHTSRSKYMTALVGASSALVAYQAYAILHNPAEYYSLPVETRLTRLVIGTKEGYLPVQMPQILMGTALPFMYMMDKYLADKVKKDGGKDLTALAARDGDLIKSAMNVTPAGAVEMWATMYQDASAMFDTRKSVLEKADKSSVNALERMFVLDAAQANMPEFMQSPEAYKLAMQQLLGVAGGTRRMYENMYAMGYGVWKEGVRYRGKVDENLRLTSGREKLDWWELTKDAALTPYSPLSTGAVRKSQDLERIYGDLRQVSSNPEQIMNDAVQLIQHGVPDGQQVTDIALQQFMDKVGPQTARLMPYKDAEATLYGLAKEEGLKYGGYSEARRRRAQMDQAKRLGMEMP